MSLEQDVLDIGRKLQKLVGEETPNNEAATDLLNRLKELPITLDILQKTRIGMAVNVVRKGTSKEEIQTLAKGLIKSWKKLLDGQDKSKIQRQSSQDKTDSPSLNKSASNSSFTRSDSNSSVSSLNGKSSSSKSFPPSRGNDPIRNRCREMLMNSLKCEDRPDSDAPAVATAIEEAVFAVFKDTGSKYKNRVKSRVMNLRDKRNASLRELVLDGDISAEKFANMTAEELAHDDLKNERKKITAQAIKDHQLATTGGTSTGQFKCGRCGKRNTTYNQVQTRSADEPMTTFVYCQECGNRWKFC